MTTTKTTAATKYYAKEIFFATLSMLYEGMTAFWQFGLVAGILYVTGIAPFEVFQWAPIVGFFSPVFRPVMLEVLLFPSHRR